MARRSLVVKGEPGSWKGLWDSVRLVWLLIADPRVPLWTKVIPFGALLYLLSPIDLIPGITFPGIGQLDDMAVLGLGMYLFIELAPREVVEEHLRRLRGEPVGEGEEEIVIDGEYRVIETGEEPSPKKT